MTVARCASASQAGDILLVCSDGLWGEPRRRGHLASAVSAGRARCATSCRRLAEQLRARGRRRQRQHLGRGRALDRKRLMAYARPDGRAPDELRAVRFTRQFHAATPKARCWSSSATRACCAPPRVEEGVPGFLRGKGQGWVTAEYGMLPRATHTRSAREAAQGQADRAHAGDPAADRPLAARGAQSRRARRAHGHARLRRAAGRWRHAHGVDHRRLCRARRCLREARAASAASASPAAWPGGRGVGRHRRRPGRCSISTTPRTPPPRPT